MSFILQKQIKWESLVTTVYDFVDQLDTARQAVTFGFGTSAVSEHGRGALTHWRLS